MKKVLYFGTQVLPKALNERNRVNCTPNVAKDEAFACRSLVNKSKACLVAEPALELFPGKYYENEK